MGLKTVRIRRTRDNNLSLAKKRRVGRPGYEPTEQIREIVQGMALAGIQPKRIAEIIKVCEDTLYKHFASEIDGVKERLLGKAAKTVYDLLGEGNLGAACFVLKTQGKPYGWTERTEVTGKDGDPLLPSLGNLTDEQIRQLEAARRVLAEIAPQTTDRAGDRAPNAGGSTRIH